MLTTFTVSFFGHRMIDDDLIKSDATLSLAIREYMGHMYPCHGDDAYAMYIAQAVYHAIDCLPDKRVSA